jgi:hypothetical protein
LCAGVKVAASKGAALHCDQRDWRSIKAERLDEAQQMLAVQRSAARQPARQSAHADPQRTQAGRNFIRWPWQRA